MILVEDWEEKLDKKISKKHPESILIPKDTLSPLIKLCKYGIIEEYMHGHGDNPPWVFPDTLARNIKANSAYVAIALGRLEKEGFLFPLENYPTDLEVIQYRQHLIFKEGRWKEKHVKHRLSGIISEQTKFFKKRKTRLTKIIYTNSDWDGKARRINPESASFISACIELKTHPSLLLPWRCECGTKNQGVNVECWSCNKHREIPELKEPEIKNVCKLCGMPMRTHGRSKTEHTKEACVKKVIEIIHNI